MKHESKFPLWEQKHNKIRWRKDTAEWQHRQLGSHSVAQKVSVNWRLDFSGLPCTYIHNHSLRHIYSIPTCAKFYLPDLPQHNYCVCQDNLYWMTKFILLTLHHTLLSGSSERTWLLSGRCTVTISGGGTDYHEILHVFPQFPQDYIRMVPSIKPQPFPSPSFKIHYSLTFPLLMAI